MKCWHCRYYLFFRSSVTEEFVEDCLAMRAVYPDDHQYTDSDEPFDVSKECPSFSYVGLNSNYYSKSKVKAQAKGTPLALLRVLNRSYCNDGVNSNFRVFLYRVRTKKTRRGTTLSITIGIFSLGVVPARWYFKDLVKEGLSRRYPGSSLSLKIVDEVKSISYCTDGYLINAEVQLDRRQTLLNKRGVLRRESIRESYQTL